MSATQPLRIGFVAGEESGDLLGADLVEALGRLSGRDIELVGIGGRHLQARGLRTLFDPGEIALFGVTAIIRDLPRLLRRIGTTARALADARPDCIVTIDAPEFSLRVAKKVRAIDPSIPIVHYVCPSVWAWRPGRAPAMKPHVDHVLCILPFEPSELERLGGPPGTYVGHRLVREPGLLAAAEARRGRPGGALKKLLVLPGSRRSEVKSLLGIFRETIELLKERGHDFRVLMPTVPHVEALLRDQTAAWPVQTEILLGDEAKWRAFAEADAALSASGTVTLELALAGVPLVSCYKLDRFASIIVSMVKVWSASLPNLIADKVLVSERYEMSARANLLTRDVEAIAGDTTFRQWQIEGFGEVRRKMETSQPAGESAAAVVLEQITRGTKKGG